MTVVPLRFRALAVGETLCVSESGNAFLGSDEFINRLAQDELTSGDVEFLLDRNYLQAEGDVLGPIADAYAVGRRMAAPDALNYLILVPTLRCDLSCSYCQVSRVAEGRSGFDWSRETTAAVLRLIDRVQGDSIKIEFQGGEPTLRLDLISSVIARCERFARKEFVVCTNLQRLDENLLRLFDRTDVFISTSLDGPDEIHRRQRTATSDATERFNTNLRMITERYGPRKVSALPTIDANNPPEPGDLIESFVKFGFDSIFLRPINYQGFARKNHREAREQGRDWRAYYRSFVQALIERNWRDRSRVLEETYLSIALRRVFRPGTERHVDLRNPNPLGVDYIVIDHDGTIYPTDEARMLTRSRVIDLSIGSVEGGWQGEVQRQLNASSSNRDDPACARCAYQPFCGRDLVDDLSRYGRIDVPRHETEFCKRHLDLFDYLFELVGSDEPAVRYSLGQWLRMPTTPRSFCDRRV